MRRRVEAIFFAVTVSAEAFETLPSKIRQRSLWHWVMIVAFRLFRFELSLRSEFSVQNLVKAILLRIILSLDKGCGSLGLSFLEEILLKVRPFARSFFFQDGLSIDQIDFWRTRSERESQKQNRNI